MEQGPRLFCPHCGVQIIATAAFCHACGRAVADMRPNASAGASPTVAANLEPHSEPLLSQAPSYRGLIATNWIIVALHIPGIALMLLRSPSLTGLLMAVCLAAFLLATFLIAAITLSRDTIYFAGFPVGIYRSTLRKASIVCNSIMLVCGLAGVAACVATEQYLPLLGVLLYTIPSVMNLTALRTLGRFAV
jgi:hypothetical protein